MFFTLDEPLSNLDAKLRVQMRAELIRPHNDLKPPFVYVTHDQTEADHGKQNMRYERWNNKTGSYSRRNLQQTG